MFLCYVFSKVSRNLDEIDEFLKTCEPAQEKDLYIQLIKGVNTLYDKICMEGQFKKGNVPVYAFQNIVLNLKFVL